MKKTIARILSTPYAGSHYLSLLLGSNSRAMHIGEVYHLQKGVPDKVREVTYHESKVLDGIGPDNIDQIYDIIAGRVGPEVDVLVDNSKPVEWSEKFAGLPDFPQKYIHLIRDPRALVRRYQLHSHFRKVVRHRIKVFKRVPAVRARIFLAPEPMVWAYHWLAQNLRITQFFQRIKADWQLVTYRDLAVQTGVEVERLMRWLGPAYEPAQLEYWNFDHIGTQKTNYEWVKKQKTNYFDLRWQQDLPKPIQDRIAADPAINRYLQSLGLKLVDNGLTRAGSPALTASPELAAAGR